MLIGKYGKKTGLLLGCLLMAAALMPAISRAAMNVDGSDNDWETAPAISENSAVIKDREWIWVDKEGDQSSSGAADLTEFRIKSDGSKLYFLARFENFTLGTTDYVTPMVQVGISYQDEGIDRFMDSEDVRDEKVADEARWEYLLSMYQPSASAAAVITGEDMGWYRSSSGGVDPDRKGDLAIKRDAASETGFFEAGIDLDDIGGENKYSGEIINITVAVFENKCASTGDTDDLGDGTGDGIIDCISLSSTKSEIRDDTVDAYFGLRFDADSRIESNSPPEEVRALDIKIDGKYANEDVIITDRQPVFSWVFEDSDEDDIQKAVNIRVLKGKKTVADFTELLEEDALRVPYPESEDELDPDTGYEVRLRVMDSPGVFSRWSDAVPFRTAASELDIDKAKIELKVDYNNPFFSGDITKLRYTIPDGIDDEVFLAVYTLSGRLVKVLVEKEIKMADIVYTEYWDGKDSSGSYVGSGTYLVHLRVGDTYRTEKVCFVR